MPQAMPVAMLQAMHVRTDERTNEEGGSADRQSADRTAYARIQESANRRQK
jgi:hypothetical protein